MNKYALLFSILLLFGSLYAPNSVMAFGSLRFVPATSYKEKEVISFVKEHNDALGVEYLLAPIDLNNDAIDEYIIKPKSMKDCPARPLCSYQIIAHQNHKPILIGQFDAHKVRIGDKKTYGIRQVILYNEPHNDFKTATALWNPYSFRFELP